MMGHGSGRRRAGALDDHQVPRQRHRTLSQRQLHSARASASTFDQVNSLSNALPGRDDTLSDAVPRPVRRPTRPSPSDSHNTSIRSSPRRPSSEEMIIEAIDQITELLRERHHIRPEQADDFNDPRHDRNHQGHGSSTSQLMGALLTGGRADLADCRRRGDHEHHARLGDRAHAGDRPSHGGRAPDRITSYGSFSSRPWCLCLCGGAMGIASGSRRVDAGPVRSPSIGPRRPSIPGDRRGGCSFGHGRRIDLRILSRLESLATGPHRSPAIRVGLSTRYTTVAASFAIGGGVGVASVDSAV